MTSNRIFLLVVGVLLAFVLVVVAGGAYSSANDWAARVDGREISEREFLEELEQLQNNPRAADFGIPESSPGAVASGVSAAWLARSVQNTIVELEIERRDVDVTEADLQAAEQSVIQQFGGPEAWDGFAEWFREREIGRLANLLALTDHIAGAPTDEELQEEFEARRDLLARACTSHILVPTQEEAEEVTSLLAEGADFGELADERSIDTNSAVNGGEVGCFGRGEGLVAPYEAAMFALEEGEVSEPVASQFGVHVIRLDELQEPTFEEARPQLEQTIRDQAQQEFAAVMGQVLAESDISINPKYGDLDLEDPAGRFVTPPSIPVVPDEVPVADEVPPGESPFPLSP